MLKAIIIDDKETHRQNLRELLVPYSAHISIAGEADGVSTGLSAIENHNPDVVFLDIELTDGDGFDLLAKINEPGFSIIFITGFDDQAIRAIRLSALDYITKPIDPELFDKAITKLLKQHSTKTTQQKVSSLLANLNQFDKIALPGLEVTRFVSIDSIMRCESEGNYTWFFFKDGSKLLVSKNLKEYEDLLEPFRFFRVHQSHLINLKYVAGFKKSEGGIVIMEDGAEVYVARRRKDQLLALLT